MKAEIITIGDEILIGQIIDTNSAWIAKKLNNLGITIKQITSVTDEASHITEAVEEAFSQAELVLVTGGLGPTKDDITKKTLAKYFDTGLSLDQTVLNRIQSYFNHSGREMKEVHQLQAYMPDSALVLKNELGTASGMWFERDGRVLVSMPGVPYEMKYIMEESVLPKLHSQFGLPYFKYKTVRTQGIGESSLMEIIESWEDSLEAEGLKLAYLPSAGSVRLRVSGLTLDSEEELESNINTKVAELETLIPQFIFGYDDETLEELVGTLCKSQGVFLGTAESCTGGYLAHRITSVAGSSNYFKGSIISYSNEMKVNQLGVDPADLKSHGAVSQPVVEAMAKGAKVRLDVDYALSTSGIAGPDGGSGEKPVGTIWIAMATPHGVVSRKLQLGKHRESNIKATAEACLRLLQKELMKRIE